MDPQPVNAETDLKVATKDTEDCCKIWFGGKKQQPFTTIHPLNYPPLKPIQIASSRMTRYFWVTAELTAVYDIKKVNQPCKTISICLQLQGSLIFSFIEMRKIRSTLPWRTALHSEWQWGEPWWRLCWRPTLFAEYYLLNESMCISLRPCFFSGLVSDALSSHYGRALYPARVSRYTEGDNRLYSTVECQETRVNAFGLLSMFTQVSLYVEQSGIGQRGQRRGQVKINPHCALKREWLKTMRGLYATQAFKTGSNGPMKKGNKKKTASQSGLINWTTHAIRDWSEGSETGSS